MNEKNQAPIQQADLVSQPTKPNPSLNSLNSKSSALPFPLPKNLKDTAQTDDNHQQCRPKPQRYADRTWMPPRGTRRSMGKR